MTKFRDGLIGPTLILLAICLAITFALAGTYQATKPVIEQANIAAANIARFEVLPEADSFTQVEGVDLPEGVLEAYAADNGAGFVFKSQAKGYGGFVTYMIALDPDGVIVDVSMFEHSETPGLGTKVGERAYLDQYKGETSAEEVDAISGATLTSNSLKNSLRATFEAFADVKEAA